MLSGVVLHPGSAKTGDVGQAIARAGETISAALAESGAASSIWRTPPAPVARSERSFDELAALSTLAAASTVGVVPGLLPPFASGL